MSNAASVLRLSRPINPVRSLPEPELRLFRRSLSQRNGPGRRLLGQVLLDQGKVDPGNLLKALAMREREEARLGDILLARGWVSEKDLMAALAEVWQASIVDLVAEPPDARLIDRLGSRLCLAEGVVPWRRIGATTIIATARPEDFAAFRQKLPSGYGPVLMALASEAAVHGSLVTARETRLIRMAETWAPAEQSCRGRQMRALQALTLALLGLLVTALVYAPLPSFGALAVLAITSLVAFTSLKSLSFLAVISAPKRHNRPPCPGPARLPVVSVMVPLFRETDIAPRLIERLGRISYPKELLDVLLVTEATDTQTRAALAGAHLPAWMRVVTVPHGPIQTKPRALNYALGFCRGGIIGVWDAEDAPAPDQIFGVVRQFHNAPPEVVCLQGILDYYNARHNWLSRCFTIEYATLFRTILPGFERLGLVLPLGGTTVFFRRSVLERLGAWDAHNVTEDADLGVRLARAGYRTEMLASVTEEEPNCRPLPWIKQRSRWLKGFAMTWASHTRHPRRLWRDLGTKRFLGVQIFFLGTLSQFLLAPILWSFWLLLFNLPHPLRSALAPGLVTGLSLLFVAAELCNLSMYLWSVRGAGHRHLAKWAPGMILYFPLATFAAYKAVYESVVCPFYWDKTRHGVITAQPADAEPKLPAFILRDPVGFAPVPHPHAATANRPVSRPRLAVANTA
ncbi:MAG: glycosyltransferase [Rhodobacteraceae bacterium]|nr:glycosyltransferase [Paracoccaceae bacterium]